MHRFHVVLRTNQDPAPLLVHPAIAVRAQASWQRRVGSRPEQMQQRGRKACRTGGILPDFHRLDRVCLAWHTCWRGGLSISSGIFPNPRQAGCKPGRSSIHKVKFSLSTHSHSQAGETVQPEISRPYPPPERRRATYKAGRVGIPTKTVLIDPQPGPVLWPRLCAALIQSRPG